jgi:hypothetical protein
MRTRDQIHHLYILIRNKLDGIEDLKSFKKLTEADKVAVLTTFRIVEECLAYVTGKTSTFLQKTERQIEDEAKKIVKKLCEDFVASANHEAANAAANASDIGTDAEP